MIAASAFDVGDFIGRTPNAAAAAAVEFGAFERSRNAGQRTFQQTPN